MMLSLFLRDYHIYRCAIKCIPDLLMGTDASLAHVGTILRIPSITTLEDDYDVIKNLARLTYPFTSTILAPEVCGVGRWSAKKIGYNGYMKLAYLHPNYFQPNRDKVNVNGAFYLIRLSGLKAHHDAGIKGISEGLLDKIIARLKSHGTILVSSENILPEKYRPYQMNIPKSDIHHYLAYAQMLLSDSQSMSVEASVLGTPNIRISDFAGRISVLRELEDKYHLTHGMLPDDEQAILKCVEYFNTTSNLKRAYQARRLKMLSEKIDVTAFLVWFIENYPDSHRCMKARPDYQLRF